MKNIFFTAVLAIYVAANFTACVNSTQKNTALESKASEKVIYTCSMHPEIRSDKPGDCPKCGMELVKLDTSDSTRMQNESDTMHSMN